MSAIDHDKLEAIIRAKRGLRAYISSRKVDAVCSTINSITALSLLDSIEAHYLASREEARQLRAERQSFLAIPQNWEIDYGQADESDDLSESGWRVWRVSGGRNDREWDLVGFGDTPFAAIRAALSPIFDQRDPGDETPDDDGFITVHP
jgi:hypothetical protein